MYLCVQSTLLSFYRYQLSEGTQSQRWEGWWTFWKGSTPFHKGADHAQRGTIVAEGDKKRRKWSPHQNCYLCLGQIMAYSRSPESVRLDSSLGSSCLPFEIVLWSPSVVHYVILSCSSHHPILALDLYALLNRMNPVFCVLPMLDKKRLILLIINVRLVDVCSSCYVPKRALL